jgi:MoxR-like ATPase
VGSPAEPSRRSQAVLRGWPAIGEPEPFVGRQWALARIDAWLTTERPGRFLVSGEPGAGKSRLTALEAAPRRHG